MDIGKVKYWRHPSDTNFVFVDKKESPLISIDVWCKAGISFEDKNKEGIAHFLEHMIFKGNKILEPGEFDLKIESLGGYSNASTSYDDVHYYVDIPKSNFEYAFNLLTNLILLPEFNPIEFELEKKVVMEEIMQHQDQIDEKIFNYFLKRIWLNHSYGKSILGNEKSVKQLSISDLKDFHCRNYNPKNICIAIAGNLPKNHQEILKNNEIIFNSKRFSSLGIEPTPAKKIGKGRKVIASNKIEFSRIYMAWRIPSSNEQKVILGFEIISSMLTDGRNSVLTRNLKEENNLVESLYSDISAGEFGSIFIIEASCIPENIKIVEDTINELIDKFINSKEKLNKELLKATRIVKSNYLFNLETSSQLVNYLGSNLLWGRLYPLNNLKNNFKYFEDINNLKKIKNYLLADKFTLIVKKV